MNVINTSDNAQIIFARAAMNKIYDNSIYIARQRVMIDVGVKSQLLVREIGFDSGLATRQWIERSLDAGW